MIRYEPALILSDLAIALATRGLLRDSAGVIERAVLQAERVGDPRYRAWTLSMRSLLRMFIGDGKA